MNSLRMEVTRNRCGDAIREAGMASAIASVSILKSLLFALGFIVLGHLSAAMAGLTVASFRAGAGTNAFAPLDQGMYFEQHFVENISPAIADVAGDWIGTNVGGSTPSWHWVGSAHTEAITTLNSANLSISGSGNFARELTTSSDFVNPNNVTVIYAPGSGASYTCFFSVDEPSPFALSGLLSINSRIRLFSFTQNATVYSKINNNAQPFLAQVNGILAPGSYSVGADSGLGGAGDHGALHEVDTGSFTNFNFTVQAPEPASGLSMIAASAILLPRRCRIK